MSTRLKDWAKTTTAPASDDYFGVDGTTNGSRKILDSAYKTDVAADFVAAPTTFKLAPLNGSNKIDVTYLPTTGDTPKGDWLADNTAPVLTDGTGTAGDYYDVTDANSGTIAQGAGTLAINGNSVAVGDRMKYDGTNWYIVPQVSNLFDGTSTQAGAATAGDYYQTGAVNDRFLDRAPSNAVVLGVNGYARPAAALSTTALQDEYTICISFRVNELAAGNVFLGQITAATVDSSGTNGHIVINADGTLDVSHYDGSYDILAEVIAAIELGKVYHLIYRMDSVNEGLTAFVDGVKGSSVASGVGTLASALWQFGTSDHDNSGTEVLGYKILNEPLSDADCVLWSKRGAVPEEYQWGKADQATNGTFASDVSWTKGAGWTIAAGVASCASGSTDLEQAQFGSAIVGHRYRVTFTVSNFSAGTITPMCGATAGTARSSNATFTEIITFASGTNLIFRSASFVGDIDDVLLEELGVTDSGQPGNIESDGWVDESSNERDLTFTVAAPLMGAPQASGTFTPGIAFNGGTTGVTYTSQEGQWRKLDEKTLLVYGSFVLSSKGAYTTETATLTGFPEVSKNLGRDAAVFPVKVGAMNGLGSAVIAEMDNNSAIATFFETAAGGAATLDAANFANTSEISFNFVYEIE